MKATSSLHETSLRVINVNQSILYVSATVLLEASERGSAALFYIQMDRKEPTTQKIIL